MHGMFESPNTTLTSLVMSLPNLISLDISGTNLSGDGTFDEYQESDTVKNNPEISVDIEKKCCFEIVICKLYVLYFRDLQGVNYKKKTDQNLIMFCSKGGAETETQKQTCVIFLD